MIKAISIHAYEYLELFKWKKSYTNLCESVLDDQIYFNIYFNMDHFSNHIYSKQRWPIKRTKNIKNQCEQGDCIDDWAMSELR